MGPCIFVTQPPGEGWICPTIVLLRLWACHPSRAASPRVIAQGVVHMKYKSRVCGFLASTWSWDRQNYKLLWKDCWLGYIYHGNVYVAMLGIMTTTNLYHSARPHPKVQLYTEVLGQCVWGRNEPCWRACTSKFIITTHKCINFYFSVV